MEEQNKKVMLGTTLAILFTGALLGLAIRDQKAQQVRYEQCVEAGMQWHKGSCLK